MALLAVLFVCGGFVGGAVSGAVSGDVSGGAFVVVPVVVVD